MVIGALFKIFKELWTTSKYEDHQQQILQFQENMSF